MATKLSNMRNNKKLMLMYVKETENYVNLSGQDFQTLIKVLIAIMDLPLNSNLK